jgi:homoserine/homoserine lactone efflux protein
MNWLHNARQQTILNRVIAAMFAGAAVVLSLVRRGAPA